MAVTLVAFAPFSFYFSAVYTESLFLALTLGAVYCARTDRWAFAGILAMFAASARNSGVLLLILLALMFLYGPRAASAPLSTWALEHTPRDWRQPRSWLPKYKLTPSIAWLLVIPIGLFAYLGYLWHTTGTPFTTFNVETLWNHQLAGPITGTWNGIVAAFDGFRQLLHGSGRPVYWNEGGDSLANAGINITYLAFVVLGVIGVVAAFGLFYLGDRGDRRVPPAAVRLRGVRAVVAAGAAVKSGGAVALLVDAALRDGRLSAVYLGRVLPGEEEDGRDRDRRDGDDARFLHDDVHHLALHRLIGRRLLGVLRGYTN